MLPVFGCPSIGSCLYSNKLFEKEVVSIDIFMAFFSSFLHTGVYVKDSMFDLNRTSIVPKSVLRFELVKDSTSNRKLPLT